MSNTIRILLVEDNPGDARLISEYLKDAGGTGFKITARPRLDEAVALLENARFDLVLLDLTLPDSSGFETFLMARNASPVTPIVILTGNDDVEIATAAVRSGAQDYLVKNKINSDLLACSIKYSIERFRIASQLLEKNAELLISKALLEEREKQLTLLSQKVISAQEEERANICRNLHDEMGQRLSAMGMEINWLEQQEEIKPEYIKNLGEALESINAELQMIYRGLRPAALDKLGMEAAIQSLIWEYKDRFDFKIHAKIESSACEVCGEKGIVIYRILQEALTNIVRHSKAREVNIGLRCVGEDIKMEIADDGIGFVPEETSKERSLGLLGMKERAAASGGELSIDSEPGRGTRIVLELTS